MESCALDFCWLLADGCSQVIQATCYSWGLPAVLQYEGFLNLLLIFPALQGESLFQGDLKNVS
jgi:hypothetical protein